MTDTEILAAISRYNWYHIIRVTDEIATPGNPAYVAAQDVCLKHLQSLDVRGKRVLDIGCRDGLFSFAAEAAGAAEVIGIDNDISKGTTEFLIPHFGSRVQMVEMNLYDLEPATFGRFDIVILPGVLYHLRYPFWGLKRVRDVMDVGGHLLIETSMWRAEPNNAMLFCPIGDESPADPSSCAFFNEKGLVDTLTSFGFETLEVEYVRRSEGRRLGRAARHVRNRVKRAARLPIRDVTRGVVHSVVGDTELDPVLRQYWYGTHSFHTERGG